MNIDSMEINEKQLEDLSAWLIDYRGGPFWVWLQNRANLSHDLASKPIGANAITDVIASQRCLAEENAYDQCKNFRSYIDQLQKDIVKEKALTSRL